MSYLLPTQMDQWVDPADVTRAYEQLLDKARGTAERAHTLAKQVAQLRNENARLAGEVRPMHKCSRCGGHDHCPKGEIA